MKDNIRQSVKLFEEAIEQTERTDMGKPCQSFVRAKIVYRKGTDSPFGASKRGFRLNVYAVTISEQDERGLGWETVSLDSRGTYRTNITELVLLVKKFSAKVMAELAHDPGIVQKAKDFAQAVAVGEQARVRQSLEQEAK